MDVQAFSCSVLAEHSEHSRTKGNNQRAIYGLLVYSEVWGVAASQQSIREGISVWVVPQHLEQCLAQEGWTLRFPEAALGTSYNREK